LAVFPSVPRSSYSTDWRNPVTSLPAPKSSQPPTSSVTTTTFSSAPHHCRPSSLNLLAPPFGSIRADSRPSHHASSVFSATYGGPHLGGAGGPAPPPGGRARGGVGSSDNLSSPDGWIFNIEGYRNTAILGFRSISRLPIELPKFNRDPLKWPTLTRSLGHKFTVAARMTRRGAVFLRSCLSTDIQIQLGECLLHSGLYERCLRPPENLLTPPEKVPKPTRHRHGLL
jgi:hypothetical protein